jgi:hypothetical protein
MDYQARLDAVNANPTERSVLDSIDRPIRGLVQQMNAHGIQTVFSCCGFNYDGEEEPKSHSNAGPFVVFVGPKPSNMDEYRAFHGFAWDAHNAGWRIDMYSNNPERILWTIRYEMLEHQKTFYQQTPDMKGIHDYELPLIAIKRLEKVLASRPGVRDYVITDGNKNYGLLDGEWQVKPKQDYIHNHEASVQDPVREPSVRDSDANVGR